MSRIALQQTGGSYRQGGTPLVDRRVNERDLRVYPELRSIAMQYAISYSGTFEPMLAAQELLREQGTLPDSIAKLVLNTAYSDPNVRFTVDDDDDGGDDEPSNVISLPYHERETVGFDLTPDPVKAPDTAQRSRSRPRPDPLLEEEEEPRERNYRIRLPATVKAPFGMSSQNGSVLHRVRPGRHFIEWRSSLEEERWRLGGQRSRGLPDDAPRDKRYLVVAWQCGSSYSGTTNPVLFLERPEDVPYCRSGCWTTYCPSCEARNVRSNDLAPDAPYPCRKCGKELR